MRTGHFLAGATAAVAVAVASRGVAQGQAGQQPGSTGSPGAPMGSQDVGGMGTANRPAPPPFTGELLQDLEKLHADDQAELQTARLALQHGQSQAVKNLASRLLHDHERIDASITTRARNRGQSLEGQTYRTELARLQQDAQQQLQGKQGAAFDQAFASLEVKDHQEDVNQNLPSMIQDAQSANEPDAAATLDEIRSTLQQHLQLALQAQQQTQMAGGAQTPSGAGSGGANTGATGQ